jgi:hypothetical protein
VRTVNEHIDVIIVDEANGRAVAAAAATDAIFSESIAIAIAIAIAVTVVIAAIAVISTLATALGLLLAPPFCLVALVIIKQVTMQPRYHTEVIRLRNGSINARLHVLRLLR